LMGKASADIQPNYMHVSDTWPCFEQFINISQKLLTHVLEMFHKHAPVSTMGSLNRIEGSMIWLNRR